MGNYISTFKRSSHRKHFYLGIYDMIIWVVKTISKFCRNVQFCKILSKKTIFTFSFRLLASKSKPSKVKVEISPSKMIPNMILYDFFKWNCNSSKIYNFSMVIYDSLIRFNFVAECNITSLSKTFFVPFNKLLERINNSNSFHQ